MTECDGCEKPLATDDDPYGLKIASVSVVHWNPDTQGNQFFGTYCSMQCLQRAVEGG